jgi:DNA end-binding protein Ku
MAASAWKGSLSFGLVTIPIRLYPAARPSRVPLHQLHSVCQTRLRQPLYCPHCERIVEHDEIIKGYQNEDGSYTLIEPEEIKKIEPESSRTMEILSFVKRAEVDPLFFDSSYFVVPEGEGKRAYALLLKALEDSERVAIAKITMHQREYTAFIRPYDHGLALHTMYFASEIREAPGYGKVADIKLRPQEIQLAERLVSTLAETFHLEKYHDEFQQRLRALLEAKRKGKVVATEPQPHRAPVIDMMTALKRSLETTARSKRPSRVAPVSGHRRLARRAAG